MATRSYVMFRLRDVLHAVEATAVQEVFRLPATTPIPQAPSWVVGIVNLRGRLVVAVDPAVWLGFPRRGQRLEDVVIILKREDQLLGIVVDEVLEVLDIDDQETEPIRELSSAETAGTWRERRLARRGANVIAILGPEEVFGLSLPGELSAGELLPVPAEAAVPDAALSPDERETLLLRAAALAQAPELQELEDLTAVAVVTWSDEHYGIPLDSVREFADVGSVTRVPCCPEHVMGIVNLRGEILTLLDIRGALRTLLGGVRAWSKMMVVQVGERRAGIVVDGILDLLYVRPSEVRPLPYAASGMARDHLLGTVPYGNGVLTLLDLAGLLGRSEWTVQAAE